MCVHSSLLCENLLELIKVDSADYIDVFFDSRYLFDFHLLVIHTNPSGTVVEEPHGVGIVTVKGDPESVRFACIARNLHPQGVSIRYEVVTACHSNELVPAEAVPE